MRTRNEFRDDLDDYFYYETKDIIRTLQKVVQSFIYIYLFFFHYKIGIIFYVIHWGRFLELLFDLEHVLVYMTGVISTKARYEIPTPGYTVVTCNSVVIS